jgi:hypothetical protein
MIDFEKLLNYVSNKVIEKHKTCLINQFDNGYFWAMKELQEFILLQSKSEGEIKGLCEPQQCEHEPGGYFYLSNPGRYRCIKCGEMMENNMMEFLVFH